MAEYLIESALLAHGLKSIPAERLINVWPDNNPEIVWMGEGKERVGGIREFCSFRKCAEAYGRINALNYEESAAQRKSGALTASGTMKACEILGKRLAVTCGMGGLTEGQRPEDCHDIYALMRSDVALVATAPKDMFALSYTIDMMKNSGIKICGYDSKVCSGYLFVCEKKAELSSVWNGERFREAVLYLRGIPEDQRTASREILEEACRYGKEAAAEGRQFHPAVNERLDVLTCGKSSQVQLQSLLANIAWAEEL